MSTRLPALQLYAVLLREGPAARERCELYLTGLSPHGPWQVRVYAGPDGCLPERTLPQSPLPREARARFVAESIEATLRREGFRRVNASHATWRLRALHDARTDAQAHAAAYRRIG